MLYKEIVEKISVHTEKKIKQKNYLKTGQIAVIDQGATIVGGYSNDIDKQITCNLPVIVFGDHTKIVKFISFPFCAGADGIKVLQPKQCILPKYLYYLTKYLVLKLEDKGYARHYQYLEKKEVTLPSLPEQERIVAKIEELFSQLDDGMGSLSKTKKLLKSYRQVALNKILDIGTYGEIVEIEELLDTLRIGPFGTAIHKSDYIEGGIPVINPQHIKPPVLHPSPKNTISNEKATELSSYRLQSNDIIMGRRGEMGRAAAITDNEQGWICGTGSLMLRLKPDYDAKLYARILSSPRSVHYLEEKATGTTMKNLNEDIIRHIPVPKISKWQQMAISQNIEAKMSICAKLELTIDAVLQQAEALRQSILKKAFNGELI